MSGRGKRVVVRAAGATVAVAALVGTMSLAVGNPAGAAPTPKANYTAGKDVATFTVTGVLDRNCLVSVGGSEVWIKPGDAIDFKSTLAGIDSSKLSLLGGLNDLTGKIAGLNVTATIGEGKSKQTVVVKNGKATTFPSTTQKALSSGDHKLSWQATGVSLLSGVNVPLSVSALKSGASLSWNGIIHVTKDAPKCKLGVSTPKVDASLGPVKVTVPQQNVNVPGVTLPNDLPSLGTLPNLPKVPTTKPKTSSSASPSNTVDPYKFPGKTVPEQVVPGADGADGGYFGSDDTSGGGGSGFDGLLSSRLNNSVRAGSGSSDPGSSNSGDTVAGAKTKTVDLASGTGTPSSQLPVILAILAILALALVAGTYAKLFLLKAK